LEALPVDVAHSCNPLLQEVPVVESFDFLAPPGDEMLALINFEQSSNLSSAQRELHLIHNKMGQHLQKLLQHDVPLASQSSVDQFSASIVF
jgi:hypothetical protein